MRPILVYGFVIQNGEGAYLSGDCITWARHDNPACAWVHPTNTLLALGEKLARDKEDCDWKPPTSMTEANWSEEFGNTMITGKPVEVIWPLQ